MTIYYGLPRYQEKHPDLPQITNSEMGELGTLQQISDHLNTITSNNNDIPYSSVIDEVANQEFEKKKKIIKYYLIP